MILWVLLWTGLLLDAWSDWDLGIFLGPGTSTPWKLFFAVSQVGPDQFFIVFAASVTVYDKAAQGNQIMQKK